MGIRFGVPLHRSVLSNEILTLLDPKPGEVFVDATLGDGGHALEVLKRIGPQGRLVGIDRDKEAIEVARGRLELFSQTLYLVWSNYSRLDEALSCIDIKEVDGILMDLGVSSRQLEDPQRGFSFRRSGPLDMRMDRKGGQRTALDLVKTLSEEELARVIRDLGQERYARRIARAVARAAKEDKLKMTTDLAHVIQRSVPGKRGRIDPATRTFQALRIRLNDELGALNEGLDKAWPRLKTGGRLAVIAFHSLEDRIVKRKFQDWVRRGTGKLLTKKVCRPAAKEVQENTRARSARLRAICKI